MASWGFICKNCGLAITHAAIPDTLWNSFFPTKPDLPAEGVAKLCPNCLATATYAPHELTYERA
jgi:hypothetical protein